jgi:8-hydroxy-5-deazaflavin:NADPH oxidoreductase
VFETVGVIGAGSLGHAITVHIVAAGLRVLIANTRGPLSLAALVSKMGENASPEAQQLSSMFGANADSAAAKVLHHKVTR